MLSKREDLSPTRMKNEQSKCKVDVSTSREKMIRNKSLYTMIRLLSTASMRGYAQMRIINGKYIQIREIRS